jgi:hypothetical protein
MLCRWNPEIHDDKGRFGQLVLIEAAFCVSKNSCPDGI